MEKIYKIIICVAAVIFSNNCFSQVEEDVFIGIYKSSNEAEARTVSTNTVTPSKVIRWIATNEWLVGLGPYKSIANAQSVANEISTNYKDKNPGKDLGYILLRFNKNTPDRELNSNNIISSTAPTNPTTPPTASSQAAKAPPQTSSIGESTESRWESYYSDDKLQRYFNKTTLSGSSNLREIDVLVNYINRNDEKASAWQTYQVKCNEVQLRLLTSRYFQGFNLQGVKKSESTNPNNRFNEPVERTHELNLYSVACRDVIKAQIMTVRSGKSREGQIDLSKVKLLVLPDGRYRIFLTRNKNEDSTYWTNVSWVDCEKGRMAELSTNYLTSQDLAGSSSARSFGDHVETNAICLLKETELPSTTPASLASLPELIQMKSLEKAYASKVEQTNQRASVLNRRKPEVDTTIAKRGPVYGYTLSCQGRPFNSPSEAITVNCNDSRAVFAALRDAWAKLRISKDQMEPNCWGMVKMAKDYIERVPGGEKLLRDASESMFAQCNLGLQNEARNGEFFRNRRQLHEVWSCDILETGAAKNTNFVKGNAPVPSRYKHFETANLNGQISYGFATGDIVKGNEWKPESSLAFQPDREFESNTVGDVKVYHEVYFFENNSRERDVLGAIRRVFIDFGDDLWARGQCKLIVR